MRLAAERVFKAKLENYHGIDTIFVHKAEENSFKTQLWTQYQIYRSRHEQILNAESFKETVKAIDGTLWFGEKEFLHGEEFVPTAIMNPPDSSIIETKTIGPIFIIVTFDTFEQLLNKIAPIKPLTIFYFGRLMFSFEMERLEEVCSCSEIVQNEAVLPPIVHTKKHGIPRGERLFRTFCNEKAVMVGKQWNWKMFDVLFPPYTKEKEASIERMQRWLKGTRAQLVVKLVKLRVAFVWTFLFTRGLLRAPNKAEYVVWFIRFPGRLLRFLWGML